MFASMGKESHIVFVKDGYRYEDGIAHIGRLLARFPRIVKKRIGYSVLGKSIDALTIGHGPEPIHINAGIHANEWITTPLLLRFVERLAMSLEISDKEFWSSGLGRSSEISLTRGLEIVETASWRWQDQITLWAVPMANPDGMNLSQDGLWPGCPLTDNLQKWNSGKLDFSLWKANIRGIDLNDQFPAGWENERLRRGGNGPASQDYGGEKPLCEPEAKALADLTRRLSFSRVLSLHTQGKEIYWNYRDKEPSGAEALALRMAKASGYQSVRLMGSDAGYKDWFIDEFGRPGFTVEAGEGVNPLPAGQFEQIYSDLEPLLLEFIRG